MHLRRALLTITMAALPVVVVSAAPANALVCPMLADATGDAGAFAGPIYSSNVDIVSADLASGATTVAGQLRVADLTPNLLGSLAPRWDLRWQINGTDYMAQVRRVVAVNTYVGEFYVENVSAGPVPFTIDEANDTISWSIPRTLIADLATPGGTFTAIKAVTFTLPSVANSASDVGTTTETYVDQTAGCISAS